MSNDNLNGNNNTNNGLNNLFDLGKIGNLLGLNSGNGNGNRNNMGFNNPLKAIGNLLGGTANTRSRNRCNVNVLPIEEAYRKIKSGEVFLLDVRTEMEYNTIRIKGSVNIPIDRLQCEIAKYNLNKQDIIIPYCSVGTRARRAIQILWSMGYTNLCIWEGAGLNNFAFQDLIVYNKVTEEKIKPEERKVE